MRVNLKKWSALIPVVMLPLGIWLGYRAFGEHGWSDIVDSILGIPAINLVLAFAFMAASYLCLTGFDALAVRYVGHRLPWPKVALTSFVSLSIGHNVGVAALSSGALRYRFYSFHGLDAVEVGKIILFCGVTVGLGLISLGGLSLAFRPDLGGGMLGLAPAAARAAGVLCLLLVAAYPVLAWRLRRPVRVRGHEFRLPRWPLAVGQIGIGTLNFACVAAALHQLLAGAADYPQMVAAYVLGNAAALLSHVPGGLGVLEYVIQSLIGSGAVIGALIGFRIVYYLVPLLLGCTLLAAAELVRWRRRRARSPNRHE